MDWWWERVQRRLPSHTVHGLLEKHLGPIRELPLSELTADRFGALLDAKEGARSQRGP